MRILPRKSYAVTGPRRVPNRVPNRYQSDAILSRHWTERGAQYRIIRLWRRAGEPFPNPYKLGRR
jgi:hypothetical protein